jgi:hypothetical protein
MNEENLEEFQQIFYNTLTDKEFSKKENQLKEELNNIIKNWSNKGYFPIFELNERENGFMTSKVEKVHFLNRDEKVLGLHENSANIKDSKN